VESKEVVELLYTFFENQRAVTTRTQKSSWRTSKERWPVSSTTE